MIPRAIAWVSTLACIACGAGTPTTNTGTATAAPSSQAVPAAVSPESAQSPAFAPAPKSSEAKPAGAALEEAPAQGEPCGDLDCRRFDSARAAFRYVLQRDPLVLGVGEAHALAGAPNVASTARRFSGELLAELEGRSSHLIVELISPNPKCQETTREVEQLHKPVTSGQSAQNQNDYVALGHHARSLGIEPFVLSPSCEELSAIAGAGADAVDRTLRTIAEVTARMALAALTKNARAERERIVVAYGGALHNDEAPLAERAGWSYGPALSRATRGRYVALDLIVREFIKDSDAWRALPWYPHFDPERDPNSAIVMRTGTDSYALFFPKSAADAEPAR